MIIGGVVAGAAVGSAVYALAARLAGRVPAPDARWTIDGRPVTEPDELIVAIRAKTPGETIVLRVRTGSEERDVRVVLDESAPE